MLLLKKVTNYSDIESIGFQSAERNIFLPAQDTNGRMILGRQTVRHDANWPNSYFITPAEFNVKLLPNIQYHGQPQTATIELKMKFNLLGEAPGLYDWILQNKITSLEDKDVPPTLQNYAHGLADAIERHLAQSDDLHPTPEEFAGVFPSWLNILRINSMQIGPRLIEPPQPTPPPAPQPTPPPVPQPTPPPAPQQPTPPPAPQQPPVSQLAEPPHQTEATPPSPPSPPTRPPLIVKNSSPQPPIQPKQPQRPQSPKKPHGCCCSHFFIFLLLIFCIVGGGLIHLVKGIKNAVVAVATPIVQLIKRPADDIQTDNASLSFQLPQSISLRFVKVKSGSYRPVPPNNGGQMPSYEITIPKDFWITEIDVTEDQWRTMMSTSLNTMGVSINEVNEFCRRLTNHFAGQLPQGYHFALPTDNEWNLAVLQHKDRLTGLARRGDVFHTRLYGFHLALVPDGK